MRPLIDTHCHLYVEPLADHLDDVLARARAAGVGPIIVPGYDPDSWRAMTDMENRDGLWFAYGLHPWVADQNLDTVHLKELLRRPKSVAVGEIGLDFALDTYDRQRQIDVLRLQLDLALELDLPVILHCRKAFDDLYEILKSYSPAPRGLLHAFSKGADIAERFLSLGLYLAFGGAITRSNARKALAAARSAPLERIVLETDAPSIGLEGIPARDAEPAHVLQVAKSLAGLKSLTLEQVAERTTGNAHELFKLV